MPLNLADLFGNRRTSAMTAASGDAQRQAARQAGMVAQSRGTNPAAAGRALADATERQRSALAPRIAQARVEDERAKAAAIQGLVGTGLGLAGQIGGMLIGGPGGASAGKGAGDALGAGMAPGNPAQDAAGGMQSALGGAFGGPAASVQRQAPQVAVSQPVDLPLPPQAPATRPGVLPERTGLGTMPQLQGMQPRPTPRPSPLGGMAQEPERPAGLPVMPQQGGLPAPLPRAPGPVGPSDPGAFGGALGGGAPGFEDPSAIVQFLLHNILGGGR